MGARRTVARPAGFALALSVVFAPALALAHEPDSYGLGSRSSAMGGAVAGDVRDFSAGYYNPAGLVDAPGTELTIGYVGAQNRLALDGQDSNVPDVHGLVGGLVAPGTIFGVPFAFGVAVHLPDTGLSRIRARKQDVPRWELYDDRSAILFLATNLAVRPVPWLELGGGVAFLAATRGRFEISGTADVLSPYQSKLRHEVDADLTSIRYPQLGARVKLDGFGALGLVYRGQTKLSLALDARLQGAVDFAGIDVPLLYELEARTVAAFLPQQVVLGASFQRVENLHVNVDLVWVNWAAYESPTAQTNAHLEASPPPGTPVTLPKDPKPTVIVPLEFQNRLVPRVGAEYVLPVAGRLRAVHGEAKPHRLVEIPLRVGYVYERSPVPPQSGLTNFVDTDRHTFSAGFGVILNAPARELPGSLHLDAHVAASILPERVMDKANAADFVGDYRASGSMLTLGATLSAVF
jgi:long-chain fatty acid transport protein